MLTFNEKFNHLSSQNRQISRARIHITRIVNGRSFVSPSLRRLNFNPFDMQFIEYFFQIPPPGNRIYLEFSHFDLEHSWSEDDGASACIFDHLTIEEYDASDAKVKTDKLCQAMPKPVNTTYTVVLKFVFNSIPRLKY